MFKVYEDILTKEEKMFLETSIKFPFYLNCGQTDHDKRYHFTHVLKNKKTGEINSPYFYDIEKIVKRICKKEKIKLNKILRAAINLTFPYKPLLGSIHQDHSFEYKQFIFYLTDGGGTNLYNKDNEFLTKIESKKFKVLYSDNNPHAIYHSKNGIRIIVVVTFI